MDRVASAQSYVQFVLEWLREHANFYCSTRDKWLLSHIPADLRHRIVFETHCYVDGCYSLAEDGDIACRKCNLWFETQADMEMLEALDRYAGRQ